MSYGLSLNGIIVHGYKRNHKKSGLWIYERVICGFESNDFCVPLVFDTKRQAQIWLLQHSSFPRFNDYLGSPSLTDELLEKLYLKGKYRLAKTNKWSLKRSGFIDDTSDMPFLCEVLIYEL